MCETEHGITIRSKSMYTPQLSIPALQKNKWAIVLIGLIPLLVLAAGGITWYSRRRR